MRALCMPPVIQRRLLAVTLALFSGLAMAAPDASQSAGEVPLQATAAVPDVASHCPAKASVPTKKEMQTLARNAQDRGMLWRVSNGGRDSWLYGTVHVGRQDWLIPGHTIMGAVMMSDQLALELNLLDPEVLKELAQGMKARDEAPELNEALKARLQVQLEKACAQGIATMRPDAQVMTLLSMAGRAQGLYPDYGVDVVLAGMATSMGRPIVSLERVQTQLNMLLSDDSAVVEESVSDGLRELEAGKALEMLNLITDFWANGRQDKLENYADWCDCVNTPRERAQFKRLIDDRNPGMADGIVALLEQNKTVFAAVGALHMAGPVGLPELLRKKGYRVERVQLILPSDHIKDIKSTETK